MYAKLLKIPTFTTYKEALRQLSPDSDVGEILLSLMKTEYEQRQENQNLRRLKRAGFPFTKTLEELDLSRYSGSINEIFITNCHATRCKFIKDRRNTTMFGNPDRGKTHMGNRSGTESMLHGNISSVQKCIFPVNGTFRS